MLLAGFVAPIASDTAQNFDTLFNFLTVTSIILFAVTTAFGLYFTIKYRRRTENDEVPYIDGNHWIEWGSIFIIAVISAVIFVWGLIDYRYQIAPKMDEYEVNVIGRQWSWTMQYQHGASLANQLVLPIDIPIKLVMKSEDVLHSFFIPAFRTKQDVVPGIFTTLRFTPNKVGTYNLFCAEYCGTDHSGMMGEVIVLSKENFQNWKNGLMKIPDYVKKAGANIAANSSDTRGGNNTSRGAIDPPNSNNTSGGTSMIPMAEKGKALFISKTCSTCHSIDGSRLVGPTFKGLWGSMEETQDGSKVKVDENYFRESLFEPMKRITKGYPPAMPTFKGQLSDDEIRHLIAYVKTLK